MIYRLYFIFPGPPLPLPIFRFDPEGMKNYYFWLKDLLGTDALGGGIGIADLESTQPIFGNDERGLIYFDFTDRITAFDSIDKHGFVGVLDKMLEFTDIPPVLQGVYTVDEYTNK